jgi:phosphoethanolamine N-methyltransferase
MARADPGVEYHDELVDFLEILWGEGYLSPGGPEEVDKVVEGIDLVGRQVLDIGCGSGGITLRLAETHGAGSVVGIDVEAPVLAKAARRAKARKLDDRVAFRQVEPGPLPFDPASFDVVFSKDAIVHIPDKERLMADVFAILRPGGWFAASDWLIGHDGDPSPEMLHYLDMEGLSFGMAPPGRYAGAMEAAGFTEIAVTSRNPWYREVARREHDRLQGTLYDKAAAAVGKDMVDHNIALWKAMLVVLDKGEHQPTHLRGRKPD